MSTIEFHEPRKLHEVDVAVYRAVAGWPTSALDEPLRRLSGAANYSQLWFAVAGMLAVFGGRRGRRAAAEGVAAIAVTSLVVNQPMKWLGARERPAREAEGVPVSRWAPMPASTSFPSGHSASAAAFAVAVGDTLPGLRWPLRVGGGAVAFSRTYTGVHYPGDVLVGVLAGAVVGRLTVRAARKVAARWSQPAREVDR